MNPIIVIVVFVSVLATLLYYLQGRESGSESKPSSKQDKKIVKVDDYQAQYEKETGKTEEKEPKEAIEVEDISQLDGVGPKYQELLRAAGYNKIQDILETTPEMLFDELNKVNIEKEITKRPPALSNVEAWIEAAKNS